MEICLDLQQLMLLNLELMSVSIPLCLISCLHFSTSIGNLDVTLHLGVPDTHR